MKKHLLIFFLAGLFTSTYCAGQSIEEKGVYSKEKKAPPKPTAIRKPAVPAKRPDPTGMITITTNEDCTVTIGGKRYDTLKAGKSKQVTLPLGNYPLVATNITTRDQVSAELSVKDKSGMFSIDLRSLIAIRERKRDSLEKSNKRKEELARKTVADSPKTVVKDAKLNPALAIIHDLSINMVPIPGGSFIMGVKGGKIKELLPHEVTINPVKFGRFEVTQKQWETIMGTSYNKSSNQGCGNCPVENVSWNEVDSFIVKINSLNKTRFRLPTEAEWEYVAKNAIEKEIEISGNASQKKVEDLIDQTAWYNKNSQGKTHPAGSKKPLMGIHDLLGNVAEWCLDYYRPDYQKDNTNNPRGPLTGKEKLVKGGSFIDTDNLKPAVRNKETPSTRKNTIGFRLVLEQN